MGNPRDKLGQGGPANVALRPSANIKVPTKTKTILLKQQQSRCIQSTCKAEAGGSWQAGGQPDLYNKLRLIRSALSTSYIGPCLKQTQVQRLCMIPPLILNIDSLVFSHALRWKAITQGQDTDRLAVGLCR